MEKMKGVSKTNIIFGVICILLLGGILFNSYWNSTSNDRYYKECLKNGKTYVEEKQWKQVINEMKKLDGIIPRDKKLIEERDLMRSAAETEKVIENPYEN